jgi:hypothetical protein
MYKEPEDLCLSHLAPNPAKKTYLAPNQKEQSNDNNIRVFLLTQTAVYKPADGCHTE